MKAQFLTLDGIDGSGKSTHLETMREWFERRGMPVLFTREPGGTPLGEELRRLLRRTAYRNPADVRRPPPAFGRRDTAGFG